MERLMDHRRNFQAYRTALKNCDLPALPYFGVFLRDITFIHVGNPVVTDDAMINIDTWNLVLPVIMDIQVRVCSLSPSRPIFRSLARSLRAHTCARCRHSTTNPLLTATRRCRGCTTSSRTSWCSRTTHCITTPSCASREATNCEATKRATTHHQSSSSPRRRPAWCAVVVAVAVVVGLAITIVIETTSCS